MVLILYLNYVVVPSGSPLSFGGNSTSSRSALLTWNPPPLDQQNGIILYYIINVTVEETGATFLLNSTDTYLTISTLQPYRNYTCVIAAATSLGIGPFSEIIFNLITPEDGKKITCDDDVILKCICYIECFSSHFASSESLNQY